MLLAAEKTRAQRNVALGVEWLDKRMPNWHNKIDLDNLELASAHFCVLGQLEREIPDHPELNGFDGFVEEWNAPAGWYLPIEDAVAYGFQRSMLCSYSALTIEWSRVIADRRELELTA